MRCSVATNKWIMAVQQKTSEVLARAHADGGEKTANRLRKDCISTALKLHSDRRTTALSRFIQSKMMKHGRVPHQAQRRPIANDVAKYFCAQQTVDFKRKNDLINGRRTCHLHLLGTRVILLRSNRLTALNRYSSFVRYGL